MSGGAITAIRGQTDRTGEISHSEEGIDPKQLRNQIVVQDRWDGLIVREHGSYIAGQGFHSGIGTNRTTNIDWDEIIGTESEAEVEDEHTGIWDTSKLQRLVRDPIGAPIELTREEAEEIVKLAFGRRPDLPPGKQVVEEVREILGHSIIERLKDIDVK